MLNVNLDTAQILRDLNALQQDLREKAVKAGLAKVAIAGLDAMKGTVPVETGKVKQSLNRKTLTDNQRGRMGFSDGTFVMLVGPNRRVGGIFKSRIANVLEGGARAHEILPGKSTRRLEFEYAQGMRQKASVLANRATGQFFGKKVNHPGLSARGWMNSADASNAGRAEGLFYTGVQDFLDRRR